MGEMYNKLRMKMFPHPGVSITAIKAYGTRILTKEYGELIDLESGCWAAVLGHSHKEVLSAIAKGAEDLFHTHQFFDTEHPGALVKELSEAAELKACYKGTFLSSGSEAVSLAVSLARLITGRQRNMALAISSLGSSSELRMPRNPSIWTDLDTDECLHCTKGTGCRECGRFSHIDFPEYAAFVFEPGNSGGVVLFPPDKLIAYLVEEIRNAGGLIITNEVTTGFGRTGKWFGFQHYTAFDAEAASPDIIAMGKGLGNGYPISGVLVKSNLADGIEASGFKYVQSHTDDPLGCIAARKVVEIISRDSLIKRGAKMGEYMRSRLSAVSAVTGAIKEIRGRGLMNVIVLNSSYAAREVFVQLLEKGFFVGYSEAYNLIRMYAPLIIEKEDAAAFCNALENILGGGMNEQH